VNPINKRTNPVMSLVFETFADQELRRREQAVDLITTRRMSSEAAMYKISENQGGENKGTHHNPTRQF
jgi:hypothetical protein